MINTVPKKRFGQHFLIDDVTLNKILQIFKPSNKDTVVEIGPGTGALTALLLEQIDFLHAIELDRELVQLLSDRFGGRLKIYQSDVLKFDFQNIYLEKPNQSKLRLIGNLPYNISTPLLIRLTELNIPFSDMVFMLQKEVAQRIVASPGSRNYGRLTVMLGSRFNAEYLFDVSPESFNPPPKVHSSVIRFTPLTDVPEIFDASRFEEIVRLAFSQRRKTIQNTLKTVVTRSEIEQLGINPTDRAENLSVTDFAKLSNSLY